MTGGDAPQDLKGGHNVRLIKEEYDLEYNIRIYNTDFTYIHI